MCVCVCVCEDEISVVISHINLKPLLLVGFKCALWCSDVTHTHTHTHTHTPSGSDLGHCTTTWVDFYRGIKSPTQVAVQILRSFATASC